MSKWKPKTAHDVPKVIITCLCGNEYKDTPAGRTVEPRCQECYERIIDEQNKRTKKRITT